MYADQHNCTIFHTCSNSRLFTQSCGRGTVFSEKSKTCVYPYDSDRIECKKEQYYVMSNDDYADNGQYEHHDEWSDDQAPKEDAPSNDNNFASDKPTDDTPCTQDGFMKDKYDCTVFYQCVGNDGVYTKYTFNCAEGTAFSANSSRCEHKADVVECQQQIASDTFSQSESQSQSNNNQQSTMSSMSSSNNGGQQSSSSSSSSSSSNSSMSSSTNTTTINNNGNGNGNNGNSGGKLSHLAC